MGICHCHHDFNTRNDRCQEKTVSQRRPFLSATEEAAPAAKQLSKIAQTQRRTHAAPGEPGKVPCLTAVSLTALLDLIQRSQVFAVARIHRHRFANMLQSRHLIAQTVIGQSAEIMPPGIPLGRIPKGIEGFPVSAEADVIEGRLLVLITR